MSMSRDEMEHIICECLYSNVKYNGVGNRCILASSIILNKIGGIDDIDMIYRLARVIDDNSDLEISTEQFDTIQSHLKEFLTNWVNRPFIY